MCVVWDLGAASNRNRLWITYTKEESIRKIWNNVSVRVPSEIQKP
jgi:hypothetical protein